MLAFGPQLVELDIHYPMKYAEMLELAEYLRENTTLVKLRIQKFKPMHLHFLSALAYNTTLKSVTLEIFKINNHHFYNQAEHDPSIFDSLPKNQVLEELNIRGSTHREYMVFSRYFGSLLGMFSNLKSLELRSISFKNPLLTGEIFKGPLQAGLR